MFVRRIAFLFIIVLLFFTVSIAVAQDSGEFDWSNLGVDVGIIAGIVAAVQLLKKFIPEKLVVFAPMVLAIIVFFVMRGEQPMGNVVYWAAAAGYFWKIANKLTPDNVMKTKAQITNGT
jgi:hypothetical protein